MIGSYTVTMKKLQILFRLESWTVIIFASDAARDNLGLRQVADTASDFGSLKPLTSQKSGSSFRITRDR